MLMGKPPVGQLARVMLIFSYMLHESSRPCNESILITISQLHIKNKSDEQLTQESHTSMLWNLLDVITCTNSVKEIQQNLRQIRNTAEAHCLDMTQKNYLINQKIERKEETPLLNITTQIRKLQYIGIPLRCLYNKVGCPDGCPWVSCFEVLVKCHQVSVCTGCFLKGILWMEQHALHG